MREEILQVFKAQLRAMHESFTAEGSEVLPNVSAHGEMCYKGRCCDYKRANAYNHIFYPHSFEGWLSQSKNIPVLFQHEWEIPVGMTTEFYSDARGLNVALLLDNSPAGQDIDLLIRAGVIQSFSMEYHYRNSQTFLDDNTLDRHIHVVHDIVEVSLVLFPAGECAMLDCAKYAFKEGLWTYYMLRLIGYYKVRRQLQTQAIKAIIEKEIDTVSELLTLSDNILINH